MNKEGVFLEYINCKLFIFSFKFISFQSSQALKSNLKLKSAKQMLMCTRWTYFYKKTNADVLRNSKSIFVKAICESLTNEKHK